MRALKMKASLVGAVIVFLWSWFSWVAVGVPAKTFKDPAAMVEAFKENAPENGVYMLPSMGRDSDRAFAEKLYMEGPVVPAAVEAHGMRPVGLSMVFAFITQFIGAYAITCLLLRTKGLKYGKKVLFITGVGFLVAWLGVVPGWIWKGFSPAYSIFLILDVIIAWFLAGLAMAKVLRKS